MKQWINTHNHTVFSILDGKSGLEEYTLQAKALGQPGATITDHGNTHGIIDFYDACMAAGVKPFLGQEFYQARKTRFDVDAEERSGSRKDSEWQQNGPYHCGIVAVNNTGYHNLIKLSSRAFLEGYYVKPRIDHELLAEHHEGLVMLSGCLSGEIQQALLRDDDAFALQTAQKMQDIFGKDNYFIEVMNHGIEEEIRVIPKLFEIAHAIGAPIVPTCDSHYTHQSDADAHDTMLCINTGSFKDQEERFRFSGPHFYLKSYDEMAQLFSPEIVDNSMLIYEKHDLKLEFGEYHFPIFDTPDGSSAYDYMYLQTVKGLIRRFGDNWQSMKEVRERVEYELGVIRDMGFPNYFLVVADIVNWARSNKILVGFGRGSVGGSIVAYALGITEADPLKYDLVFERFLVPGRKTMPDIDLDFDDRFREQVIEYTRQKYGYDHTANICTFGTMKARKAVRDTARVLGKDYALGDQIAKAMPPSVFGVPKPLADCMESEQFRKLYEEDADAKEVIDAAFGIENLVREVGMHAAGLVIADKPITDYIPVLQKGQGEPIVTQWDMDKIDRLGLLKIDFLGLRNLSIVDICIDNIKERTGQELDLYDIPNTLDKKTFDLLARGENAGLFQIESSGIQDILFGVKPESIEDISAILALYRPGPMASNVHYEFIERKHKKKPVTYLHQSLKPYLNKTHGLLLYQEQLIALAQGVAGFSIGDADSLRKAVGKKKPEEMKKWRKTFTEGCMATSKLTFDIANKLFSEIEHHASYSFSSNHSLVYSLLTYATAYLKANYPIEFMAAALSTVQDKKDRMQLYLKECRNMGIPVLPPSINESHKNFTITDDNEIAYGLSGIAGIGDAAIRAILDTRPDGGFESVPHMLRELNLVGLDKKSFEHLASAGVFDDIMETVIEEPLQPINRVDMMKLLLQESKELGVYLTANPFEEIFDLIEGKTNKTLSECVELGAGTRVVTAGIVTNMERKITKKGKKMFNVKIRDSDMEVIAVIPPKLAEFVNDPPFGLGDVIIFNARVDRYAQEENTTFQLSISDLDMEHIKLEDIPNNRPIVLKSTHALDPERIQKIYDIIQLYKGDSEVYLEFIEADNVIKLKFENTTSYEVSDKLKLLLEV